MAKKEKKQTGKIAYHPDAVVECACGERHTAGSTVKKMAVEICSACHPFFTGTQKLVDTAGQVDKFKARLKKADEMKKKPAKKKKQDKNEN